MFHVKVFYKCCNRIISYTINQHTISKKAIALGVLQVSLLGILKIFYGSTISYSPYLNESKVKM